MAPPKAKLHNKLGKLKTIPSHISSPNTYSNRIVPSTSTSQINENNSNVENIVPSEADHQFEIELTWCIQQLQDSLKSGKLTEKQATDTEKVFKILKSSNQPIIKKRQMMKSTFGDYRLKMLEEEKKLGLRPKQIKFNSPASSNTIKSFFVKKSVFTNSEKNFKFYFILPDMKNLDISKESTSPNDNIENGGFYFLPSNNSFKFNFSVEDK